MRELIQNMVGTFNVQTMLEEGENKNARRFKLLVIFHAEALTITTQYLLKELMERYVNSFRVIFHTNNLFLMEKPLRSLCLMFDVKSPSVAEVQVILQETLKENKKPENDELCEFIASQWSNKN